MNKYNRLGYFIGEDIHLRSQLIYDHLTVGDNFVTNPGGAAEAGEFVGGHRIPKTLIAPGGINVDGYGSSFTSLQIEGTKSGSGSAEPKLTLSRRGFNGSDGDRAGTLVFECPPDDSTEGTPMAAFNASWSDVSSSYAKLAIGIRSTAKLPPIAGLEVGYGRVIEGVASGATQIDVLLALGTGSTTTVAGDLTVSGSDFTFDSVALTGIQTSSESFSNDDVSLMTSAAIQDEVLSSAPAVTLAGSLDYLTISGQEITRNAIDLAADVTGTLPTGSGGTGSTSTTYCSLTANVSGTLPVANGGTGATSLTDNKLLTGTGTSAVTAEANATYDGADLTLTSATSTKPILSIENTTHDANAGELRLIGRRSADASVIAGAGDDAGTISFVGENAKTGPDPETITYSKIVSESAVVTDGGEMGKMTMSVGHNGTAIGGSLGFLDFMSSTASVLGETTTYGSGAIFSTTLFNSTITEFQSTASTAPIMSIKNLTNDATGGQMTFMNSRGGTSLNAPNVNGDDLGTIRFAGFDSNAASAPGITTTFAQILGEANEITNGSEEGKLTLSVASHDAELQPGLIIVSGNAEDEVDVTIGNGATSLTTIAGDLDIDGDKITTAGNIEIETSGSGDIVLDAAGDITLETANGVFTCDAAALNFNGATSSRPSFNLINNANDATGPTFELKNLRDGNGLEDGDVIGNIVFTGEDEVGATQTYATIIGSVSEADNADEAGSVVISVANDGDLRNGITMTGDKSVAEEVDVTIANGATSETTIAGNLTIDGGTTLIKAADSITGGRILIREASSNGTNYVGFNAPASIGTSKSYQLPAADGNASDFLQTNGSGVLTWAAAGGGAASPVSVSSGSQAAVGMQIARRTITQAEANAMNSTPIELIPAQGANTIIVPSNGIIRVDRAATQTNSSADLNFHYESLEPGVFVQTALVHLRRFMFNETGDRVFGIEQFNAEIGQNLTQSVNKAIEMSFDAATTTNCFTSIDVFMTYYVLDIS